MLIINPIPFWNSPEGTYEHTRVELCICIAKHQNMTKAARELYISQPTLSKHLGKLERELGIKLFNRVDNCYIPTYAAGVTWNMPAAFWN